MIAVLGCGPAGLMAAYAAAMAGNPVVIFSNPEKSKLGGAQFLHKPIPGINNVEEPDAVITYRLRGDAATYQRKVYGDDSVPFVSFSGLENGQKQDAWNLIETYDKLWAMLGDQSLTPKKITPEFVQQLLDSKDFSTVFSTVPLPAICKARDRKSVV